MSYQVIARKYRPQRFNDVVGQDHVTTTLANAIRQNRIAHAFLFCGPRGTGKTTIARIFAKCLNCTDGPSVEFPDDDPHCQEIAEGRSMDVLEIDGASNNGVEQVRELRETVKYAPASSRFKIYIIDEVHMLSTAAFNALLKTLEEPPAHVKFMFATTEPEKVLATILSRCQRFDLRRIPLNLIIKHISHIAKQEKVNIDENALHAIARGADGCMRDAESALDQLISFCGEEIAENDVLSMFGLTSRERLSELARTVLDGDAQAALRGLNDLASQGKELGRLLSDLLAHFRNVLLFRVSNGDVGLLEASEAEIEKLKEQAGLVDAMTLNRIMEVFTDAEMRFRDTASRKILLEVTLIKAIEARTAVNIDALLQTLGNLRSGQPATAPVQPRVSTPQPSSQQAPSTARVQTKPESPPPQTAVDSPAGESLEVVWTQLLDSVSRASRFVHTYLVQAHPIALSTDVLTIGFDPEFEDQMGLADNSKTHELLQTKLRELGHSGTMVKFVIANAPKRSKHAPQPAEVQPQAQARQIRESASRQKVESAKPRKAAPPEFSKEEFKNDPLIKKALDVFKGQIVDIRG